MTVAKRLFSIGWILLWLWPSFSVWGLGLHLALDHSGSAHAEDSPCHSHAERDPAHAPDSHGHDSHGHPSHGHDHGGGCHGDLALKLADVAGHGHSHGDEGADASDHSHDVTLFASKLLVSPIAQPASLPIVAVVELTATPGTSVSEAAFRRGPPPPLFTSNCSLLL